MTSLWRRVISWRYVPIFSGGLCSRISEEFSLHSMQSYRWVYHSPGLLQMISIEILLSFTCKPNQYNLFRFNSRCKKKFHYSILPSCVNGINANHFHFLLKERHSRSDFFLIEFFSECRDSLWTFHRLMITAFILENRRYISYVLIHDH